MTTAATFDQLAEQGVIPVLRLSNADLARSAISLLREAGFTAFEITLTIPGALEVITELASRPDVLGGAGTVTSLDEARKCIDAGARFLVSPCLVDGLPDLCRQAGVVSIMGALTPTEVAVARLQGADGIKIFPVSSVAGPNYVRALLSVFPEIRPVPTGGIDASNVIDYFEAGASCVGVGSSLLDPSDLVAGRNVQVVAKASEYLNLVRRHRGLSPQPDIKNT